MIPKFNDPAVARAWRAYFTEVDRLLASVDGDDRAELRADLETHLMDSFAQGEGSENDRLANAMRRLGRPIDYLRPIIAEQLVEQGTRRYAPTLIARGLYHSLKLGSKRAAVAVGFALGYMMLVIFALMAVLKPVWGDHVGLFRAPDGTISFGIVANASGASELLGLWIIPIALLVTALLYLVLTRVLRSAWCRL
jgi:uncharacterized membrane protein